MGPVCFARYLEHWFPVIVTRILKHICTTVPRGYKVACVCNATHRFTNKTLSDTPQTRALMFVYALYVAVPHHRPSTLRSNSAHNWSAQNPG